MCSLILSLLTYELLYSLTGPPQDIYNDTVVPKLRLSDGNEIPQLGLGTARLTPNSLATKAIKDAIEVGYRHFDTALRYDNEFGIGSALKHLIKNGTLKREELWITTKVWNTYHSRPKVMESLSVVIFCVFERS